MLTLFHRSQRLLPVPPWFDRRTTKTTSFSWLRAARVTHIYHCQYAERVWEICLLDPSSWDAAARTHRTLAYTFKHTQTRRPPTTSNARRTIHPTTSNTTDCTRQHPVGRARPAYKWFSGTDAVLQQQQQSHYMKCIVLLTSTSLRQLWQTLPTVGAGVGHGRSQR